LAKLNPKDPKVKDKLAALLAVHPLALEDKNLLATLLKFLDAVDAATAH
jgi:hypothetical protein